MDGGAEIKRSFPPVVDDRTTLLILGSLPGEQSLRVSQYYGNPRNQFWRLAGLVSGRDLVPLTYPDRLAALQSAGIGLWDVIASAIRPGSLDGRIRDAVANPLAELVATLPHLRAIAFNGGKASSIGRAMLPPDIAPALINLPSSSPAHAIAFEHKAAAWLTLRPYLDRDQSSVGASSPPL